jgi:antitoxin component HigA of HigAB toxin-antitoxin module
MKLSEKTYMALVERFPLVQIRDRKHLRAANELSAGLVLKGNTRSKGETEYLKVLSDLIHAYESRTFAHLRIRMSHGEILRSLLENSELTQMQLAKMLGTSQARISDIISNRRQLSKAQIMQLCLRFKLSADLFFTVSAQALPRSKHFAAYA